MSGRIPLPDPCPVGNHEPVIEHRSCGVSAKLQNVCGKCRRRIYRDTLTGGQSDPWMTDEQRADPPQELREEAAREEHEDSYQGQAERCPPRE